MRLVHARKGYLHHYLVKPTDNAVDACQHHMSLLAFPIDHILTAVSEGRHLREPKRNSAERHNPARRVYDTHPSGLAAPRLRRAVSPVLALVLQSCVNRR